MRVLVANQPRLLRDCLAEAIADFPGMEVATEESNEDAIIRALQNFSADFVFVTLDKSEYRPRMWKGLFRRRPDRQILAVGRKSLVLFWLEQDVQSAQLEYSLDAIFKLLGKEPAEKQEDAVPVPTAGQSADLVRVSAK